MSFLPIPASADLPILCARLGVFMPCQESFQIEDIQIYFSCPLLKAPILQFNANLTAARCFDAFPKAFQIEDIQIHYSPPPLQSQILQFYVQSSVFWGLPKGISNRKYSNMLFLPTPASADLPILCARLGVFMPCQKSFQIEDIQIYFSCPLLQAEIL